MGISLGNINFGLGADTAALTKAMDKLTAFGQQVDTVSRRQSDGADKVAAAYRRQEAAMTSALQKTMNFNAQVAKVGAPSTLASGAAAAFTTYTSQLTKGQQSALNMQRANTRLQASFGTLNRELGAFTAAKVAAEGNSLVGVLRNLATTSTLALGPLGGVASRVSSFATIMDKTSTVTALFVAGAAAGAVAAFKIGEAMVEAQVKMTQLRMGLTAITGSSDLAAVALSHVVKIAQDSGQDLGETAIAYTKFMASANDTSLSGAKAEAIFTDITMAIGRLHLSAQNAQGVFQALDQMMAKGTVTAGPLRQMMRNGLPDAYGLMAQAAETTTAKMMQQMSQGKLLSDQVLPRLAAAITKTFHIDGQPVDTYLASVARLNTAYTQFMDSLDKSVGLSNTLKALFTQLASVLDYLREHMSSISTVFSDISAAMDYMSKLTPFGHLMEQAGLIGKALIWLADRWKDLHDVIIGASTATISDSQQTVDGLDKVTASLKTAAGGWSYMGDSSRDALVKLNSDLEKQADQIRTTLQTVQHTPLEINAKTGLVTGGGGIVSQDSQVAQLKQIQTQIDRNKASLLAFDQASKENESRRAPAATGEKDPTAAKILASANALARFNDQYNAYINQTAALNSGDQGLINQIKLTDEETKKMQEYKQTLDRVLISEDEKTKRLNAMRDAMIAFDAATIESNNHQKALKEMNDALGNSFDTVGKSLVDMALKGKFSLQTLADAFKTAGADILETLIKLAVLNPLKNGLFGLTGSQAQPVLGGMGSGGGGIFGSLIGKLFGGGSDEIDLTSGADTGSSFLGDYMMDSMSGRASGGSTAAGRMYMVGEHGPELWHDDAAGNVINNGNLKQMMAGDDSDNSGSGEQYHVHLNVSTGVQQTVVAELNRQMPVITKTLAGAMVEARRRGGSFANAFRSN